MKKKNDLISECYQESVKMLKKNSTEYGSLASGVSKRAIERNYVYIFGRDSAICSLGMVASKDKDLIKISKNSLISLAKFQADNGQIPNCVNPANKYVNFWIMGCVDATLWWLFALDFYDRNTGDKKLKKKLEKNIEKAINWLLCQEHPLDGLLIQNEASDWADLMPRTGKVLYSNALWLKIKKIYKIRNRKKTSDNLSKVFFYLDSSDTNIPICDKKLMMNLVNGGNRKNYYFSFVNQLFWGKDIDVFANSLVILFLDKQKERHNMVIDEILKKHRNKKLPMPVMFGPIKTKSKYWRGYMSSHRQNFPYQYHNGGSWPFVSCFWVLALAKQGKYELATKELEIIASVNKRNNWEFNEWFHYKTNEALGMKKQSWNAGAFLLAYHFLNKDINL